MANDSSIRAFKCPTCGAPLEPQGDAASMKCGFCGSTVVVPESLRTPPPQPASPFPQYNFGPINMNAMFNQAQQMPIVYTMAHQGRFEEAAKLYAQLTGLSFEDAMKAVKGMGKR